MGSIVKKGAVALIAASFIAIAGTTSAAVAAGAPGPVTNLRITNAAPYSVSIAYNLPADNGGSPIGVCFLDLYRSNGSGAATATVGGGTTSYTFSSGVRPGETYFAAVSCGNSVTYNQEARSGSATTPDVAPNKTGGVFGRLINGNSIEVAWGGARTDGKAPVQGYTAVLYRNGGEFKRVNTGSTSTVFSGLPGGSYTFAAAAYNAVGTGAFTSGGAVNIAEPAPAPKPAPAPNPEPAPEPAKPSTPSTPSAPSGGSNSSNGSSSSGKATSGTSGSNSSGKSTTSNSAAERPSSSDSSDTPASSEDVSVSDEASSEATSAPSVEATPEAIEKHEEAVQENVKVATSSNTLQISWDDKAKSDVKVEKFKAVIYDSNGKRVAVYNSSFADEIVVFMNLDGNTEYKLVVSTYNPDGKIASVTKKAQTK